MITLNGLKPRNYRRGLAVVNGEALVLQGGCEVTSRRYQEVQACRMPISPGDHLIAFDHGDQVKVRVRRLKCSVVAVELVEGKIEKPLHVPRIGGNLLACALNKTEWHEVLLYLRSGWYLCRMIYELAALVRR